MKYTILAQLLPFLPELTVLVGPDHRTVHHAFLWAGVNLPRKYGRSGSLDYAVVRLDQPQGECPKAVIGILEAPYHAFTTTS